MRTRANSVFKGIAIIFVMAWISDRLQLHTISWALQLIINTGIIVLVILFQPELRRGLDQIGRSRITKQVFNTQRRQLAQHSDQVVSEMVKALTNMSRSHRCRLIVIERQTSLSDVAESGTRIDAEISDPRPKTSGTHDPARRRDHRPERAHSRRRVHPPALRRPFHQPRAGHAPQGGHRHDRGDGRGDPHRFRGDGHHLHGAEGRLTRYLDTKSLTILLTELFAPTSPRPRG